jgi:hypothetical protein
MERAVSTAAQFLLAVFGVDGVLNLANIDFAAVVTGTALAAGLSVLKSIVALKTTDGNSASLTVKNVEEK